MADPGTARFVDLLNARRTDDDASMAVKRASLEALIWQLTVAPNVACRVSSIGSMLAEWVAAPGAAEDRVILYLHGGSYLQGSPNTHRDVAARLSRACGARAFILDYRLAPEHPFPAAQDDALAAYRWLLANGFAPGRIALAGDSAGGGLLLSTLVAIGDAGEAMPSCAACISPWTDLACTGESMLANAGADPFLTRDGLMDEAALVLGGADPRNPRASPLYADLRGLPPLLVMVGSTEILLDDSTRLVERARAAGVAARLEVWTEAVHAWPVFAAMIPDGRRAIRVIGRFVRRQMPVH